LSTYAIGDLHGCPKTLLKTLRVIEFDENDTLVLLGDYIDRGPDSARVISEIIKLQSCGFTIVPLKGNHEQYLLDSYNDKKEYSIWSGKDNVFNSWMMNGGRETLLSYGYVDSGYCKPDWKEFIPKEHIDWMFNLPIMFITPEFVFVHAGLDFSTNDPIYETSDDCALWSRTGYIDNSKINNRVLITGHTPQTKEKIISMIENVKVKGHIIIDRGCVYPQSNYNHLAVLNLDTMECRFIKNIDIIERDM
jgi:serine/threonine protein phosphatase 1